MYFLGFFLHGYEKIAIIPEITKSKSFLYRIEKTKPVIVKFMQGERNSRCDASQFDIRGTLNQNISVYTKLTFGVGEELGGSGGGILLETRKRKVHLLGAEIGNLQYSDCHKFSEVLHAGDCLTYLHFLSLFQLI
jgi:hypothetical protein